MAKAVFQLKPESIYDDLPEERYHFPQMYFNDVNQSIGDLIIYYEPSRLRKSRSRKGGRSSYFAVAQIAEVIKDLRIPNHYYAIIKSGSYLEFPEAVPFREGSFFYESKLRKKDGTLNKGASGRSVRCIPDNEFDLILKRAFGKTINASETTEDIESYLVFEEVKETYDRPFADCVISKPFRDQAFRDVIRKAYNSTCAITGMKIINGHGNCEIDAAHIKPVSHFGPDSPRNGIALSKTIHWLFDRGLMSLEDDGRFLLADKYIPNEVKVLMNRDSYARLPELPQFRPHVTYLHFHREHIFIG